MIGGIVSYGPAGDGTFLCVRKINYGQPVRGFDHWLALENDGKNFWGDSYTGEIKLGREGTKVSLKEVNVKMFCTEGSSETYLPWVAVMARDSDESAWIYTGDSEGTFVAGGTDDVMTGTGTAWSNVIGLGDDVETDFTTPCLAAQGEFYRDTAHLVLNTDYTVSNPQQITLASALLTGETLYCYWTNRPYVVAKVGDRVWTSSGGVDSFIGVSSISTRSLLAIEREVKIKSNYKLVTAIQCPNAGESEVKYAISGLFDTLQLRVLVFPVDSASAPPEVKVIGADVVYVPSSVRQFKQEA